MRQILSFLFLLQISADSTFRFVQQDNTIRLIGHSNKDFCVFKRYASYNVGDEVWFKSCDVENHNINKAGKYQWKFETNFEQIDFEENTGLVKSLGAESQSKNLCWKIQSLTRYGKQRVKLANCDPTDALQIFKNIDGRLHSNSETRICLGIEEHKLNEINGVALTFQDCYSTVFGNNQPNCQTGVSELVESDKTIRIFMDTVGCLFKKYSGYNKDDEIWVKLCDSENTNQNKAQKFWFSYDKVSGLIESVGSRNFDENNVMCLRINSLSRFYKQRVRLAKCDASDDLQTFDYLNGRIYSRGNGRLCAGVEWWKYRDDGTTAFVFSSCYPDSWVRFESICTDDEEVTTEEVTTEEVTTEEVTTEEVTTEKATTEEVTTKEETTKEVTTEEVTTEEIDTEPTRLQKYLSEPEPAYSWTKNTWTAYGETPPFGLIDYAWITLTSLKYNSTLVKPHTANWIHNVTLCVGPETDKSKHFGMMRIGKEYRNPTNGQLPMTNDFTEICKEASELGVVGVIIEGVPKSNMEFEEFGIVDGEGTVETNHGFHGLSHALFLHFNESVETVAEYPGAKAIAMAFDMVDEYLIQNGIRDTSISKWSIRGPSKRSKYIETLASADERVVATFPEINPGLQCTKCNLCHLINIEGSVTDDQKLIMFPYSRADGKPVPVDIEDYEKTLHLENQVEKLSTIPTHFIFGTKDTTVKTFDSVNSWWPHWNQHKKITIQIVPNMAHANPLVNPRVGPWYITMDQLINEDIDSRPYLNWNIQEANTMSFCLENATDTFTGEIFRGTAVGRKFENANMVEVGNCSSVNKNLECSTLSGIDFVNLGDSCYKIVDNLVESEGVYSAVYLTVNFVSGYTNFDGDAMTFHQSTGPLVKPNAFPYQICGYDFETESYYLNEGESTTSELTTEMEFSTGTLESTSQQVSTEQVSTEPVSTEQATTEQETSESLPNQPEPTRLQKHISTKDDSYSWTKKTWNAFGNPVGISDYAWITLDSQTYLNSTYVNPQTNKWKHHVTLCVGHATAKSKDYGIIKLERDKDFSFTDPDFTYPATQFLARMCTEAAKLGIVAVNIESIPMSGMEINDELHVGPLNGEYLQTKSHDLYFDHDFPIEALAEYAAAKTVSMVFDMVDEYLVENNIRENGISKWSIRGESKRGGYSSIAASAENRIVATFPEINNGFQDKEATVCHTINIIGPSSVDNQLRQRMFTLTDKNDLNSDFFQTMMLKHKTDRMSSLPTHFVFGFKDPIMPIDAVNTWWNAWNEQKLMTMHILPEMAHDSFPGYGPKYESWYTTVDQMINNQIQTRPYLNWEFNSSANSIQFCLENPTDSFSGEIYRGTAAGRKFMLADVSTVGTCSSLNGELECSTSGGISFENLGVIEGSFCYQIVDNIVESEGVYSGMYFTVNFLTDNVDFDGELVTFYQSTGPLVKPDSYPYQLCEYDEETDSYSLNE